MRLNLKQKSTFFKLFVSYLLMVILMISLIFGMVFSFSRYNLEQEVLSLNNTVLTQYARIVDALIIHKAEKTVTDFTVSTGFIPLLARMAYAGEEAVIPNYVMHQRLREILQPYHNLLKAIHIFNPSTDVVVSSNYGVQSLETLTPHVKRNLDWIGPGDYGSGVWKSVREQKFSVTGETKRVMTYIKEVQLIRSDVQPPLVFGVDIYEDDVIEILSKHTASFGETFLLSDLEGRIQFQVGTYLPMEELNEFIIHGMEEGTVQSGSIKGDRYVSSRARLSNGWFIHRLVPLRFFYRVSNQLILNASLLSVFLILGGVVIAYYLSKYFYTPIATLESRITGLIRAQKESPEDNQDEFAHINRALNDIDSTLAAYYQEQERKIPRLKGEFIRNALYGNYKDEETFRHHLTLVCGNGAASDCAVFLISFPPAGDSHFNLNRTIQSKIQAIGLIEDLSDENRLYLGAEIDRTTLAFLCFSPPAYDSEEEEYLALYGRLTETIGDPLIFSYGDSHKSYDAIDLSFREARQALKHSFFYPDRFMFSHRLIRRDMDYDSAYLEKQNGRLKKAFLSGQYDDARDVMAGTVDFLIGEPYSFIAKELCLHTMTQVILAELFKLELSDQIPLEELLVRYRGIGNIREYGQWIHAVVELLKQSGGNSKPEQHRRAVEELKTYIGENLAQDLSLTRLADRMKLSNGYLSRIFLEIEGLPLNEYIARERMEHARALLVDSHDKISHIARESGYLTPHYFSKKFKEHYGKTPQDYRLTEGRQAE